MVVRLLFISFLFSQSSKADIREIVDCIGKVSEIFRVDEKSAGSVCALNTSVNAIECINAVKELVGRDLTPAFRVCSGGNDSVTAVECLRGFRKNFSNLDFKTAALVCRGGSTSEEATQCYSGVDKHFRHQYVGAELVCGAKRTSKGAIDCMDGVLAVKNGPLKGLSKSAAADLCAGETTPDKAISCVNGIMQNFKLAGKPAHIDLHQALIVCNNGNTWEKANDCLQVASEFSNIGKLTASVICQGGNSYLSAQNCLEHAPRHSLEMNLQTPFAIQTPCRVFPSKNAQKSPGRTDASDGRR